MRFEVHSADGVPIAVWAEGEGPALVMVHGMMSDHTTFAALVAELGRHLTTFAIDRRGRGASADRDGYAIEREFRDVATVADAVAARTGGPVALWGHSYGAGCAMGGAALSANVSHLIAYEPGLGAHYPEGAIERIERSLAAGDRDAALVTLLAEVLGLDDAGVSALRDDPMWPSRLAAAPTLPRECRAERDWVYRPGALDAITARTLVLMGADSDDDLVATTRAAIAALPSPEVRVLDGHGHFAHRAEPALVAAIVRGFLAGEA